MPDGRFWFDGSDIKRPVTGEHRIGYSCLQFTDRHITLIAKQNGSLLQGDSLSSGNRRFTCIRPGKMGLDDMFAEASRDNERAAGDRRKAGILISIGGLVIILGGIAMYWPGSPFLKKDQPEPGYYTQGVRTMDH